MSHNRRVYRTIKMAIQQLLPRPPKGNFGRNLNTPAGNIQPNELIPQPIQWRQAPETRLAVRR